MLAAAICAALLIQMTLPAVHAVETTDVGPSGAAAWDGACAVAHTAQPAPAHDPATCPVCQSLLRTSPAVSAALVRAETCAEHTAARSETRPCVHDAAAQTGHPPRAPPARAFHLV